MKQLLIFYLCTLCLQAAMHQGLTIQRVVGVEKFSNWGRKSARAAQDVHRRDGTDMRSNQSRGFSVDANRFQPKQLEVYAYPVSYTQQWMSPGLRWCVKRLSMRCARTRHPAKPWTRLHRTDARATGAGFAARRRRVAAPAPVLPA